MSLHLFSLAIIQTRGLHAHVQSERVPTSAVKSKSLQSTKSQSAKPSRKPQDFWSIPTSIHKYPCPVSCHVPRCPIPFQHISHWIRPNELPQDTFSNNTKSYFFAFLLFRTRKPTIVFFWVEGRRRRICWTFCPFRLFGPISKVNFSF